MRRGLACVAGFLLCAAALSAAPCTPSPTVLCLNDSRFEVEVSWRDSRARTGVGQAVSITADTGYFWFFSETNIELVIKVLDARSINQKYWVFFGALTSVEFDLTVTDTATGAVKTYHNDLGNFASVGDTGAFSPTPPAAGAHETVTVEGTVAAPESLEQVQGFIDSAQTTAAFTPCRETSFGFLLNGCRFHIEVDWQDSRGRTGIGQPVQLTSDTGYFWFFNPSNVELMVKVLDARAVNGKFWVFFGALSNVQYGITVRDTVTGAHRRYANPSGTFASVGDTAAFRGGLSVGSVPDSGRAASANLSELGGSVTTTGVDGTVFTLEIPQGALAGPETVTLTPVSRIDRFPFSGGLVAGVEIEPLGRTLMLAGTLTIQPVSPPHPDRTLPYSYDAGGEDFILYPRDPDSSTIRLPIERLGGYGVGEGGADDAESQTAREPAGPLSPYLQRYAREVFQKALGLISRDELAARGTQIFHEAFEHFFSSVVSGPGLSTIARKDGTCPIQERRDDLETLLGIERQRQMLGITSDEDTAALLQELIDLLHVCQQEAFDRCVALNDPYEVLWMAQLARQMTLLGDEDPNFTTFIENGLMESCLRFEIDFESKFVEEHHSTAGVTTTRLKYRAQHVPLRFNYAGNDFFRSIWEGACTVLPEVVEIELPVPLEEAECSLTIEPGNGWFNVAAAWIAVMNDPSVSAVRVLYDPGDPTVNATLHCKDTGDTPFPVFQWSLDYWTFHQNEFWQGYGGANFGAKDWEQLRYGPGPSQNGEFFAKKSYERERVELDTVITEETWFFLKHTPGAPMPTCQSQ